MMAVSMKGLQTEEGKKLAILIEAFLESGARKVEVTFEGLEVKGRELAKILRQLEEAGFMVRGRGDELHLKAVTAEKGKLVIEIEISNVHIDDESKLAYTVTGMRMRRKYF